MSWHRSLSLWCLPALLSCSWLSSIDAVAITRIFDNESGDNDWFNLVNWHHDGNPSDTDVLTVGGGDTVTTSQNVIISNDGSITINDAGTDVTWSNLNVGLFGVGNLLIQSGAHVKSFFASAGTAVGLDGTIVLDGNGTEWDAGQLITIGGV